MKRPQEPLKMSRGSRRTSLEPGRRMSGVPKRNRVFVLVAKPVFGVAKRGSQKETPLQMQMVCCFLGAMCSTV